MYIYIYIHSAAIAIIAALVDIVATAESCFNNIIDKNINNRNKNISINIHNNIDNNHHINHSNTLPV